MSKFNLDDLILNEKDATNPKTYTIKIDRKFDDETLVNFSAAIITHYIKNKINDSPEIEEIIINENLISYDDRKAIFYSLLNLFHYKNIENDSLIHITKDPSRIIFPSTVPAFLSYNLKQFSRLRYRQLIGITIHLLIAPTKSGKMLIQLLVIILPVSISEG